jgi:hypothetical protein
VAIANVKGLSVAPINGTPITRQVKTSSPLRTACSDQGLGMLSRYNMAIQSVLNRIDYDASVLCGRVRRSSIADEEPSNFSPIPS